jgi:hypothetical protein
MKKLIFLVLVVTVFSCREKEICPTGPYQIATIRITGDSLVPDAGFLVKRYPVQDHTLTVDSLQFSADSQGHLKFDLEVSGKYNYIISCDTLKIRDTVSSVEETRDHCGNNILFLSFRFNGKPVTDRTIRY